MLEQLVSSWLVAAMLDAQPQNGDVSTAYLRLRGHASSSGWTYRYRDKTGAYTALFGNA